MIVRVHHMCMWADFQLKRWTVGKCYRNVDQLLNSIHKWVAEPGEGGWGLSTRWRDTPDTSSRLVSFSDVGWRSRALPQSTWCVHRCCRRSVFRNRHFNCRQPTWKEERMLWYKDYTWDKSTEREEWRKCNMLVAHKVFAVNSFFLFIPINFVPIVQQGIKLKVFR